MKETLKNLPLGIKIALLSSLLVGLSLLILTVITIEFERNYYRQELADQASVLLGTLPFSIRDELYFIKLDELQDVAGEIGESPNIIQFVIYDRNGAILADSNIKESTFAQEADPFGKVLVSLTADEERVVWEEHQFTTGRPIYIEDQKVGAIAVTMSTATLDKKIKDLIKQSLLLTITIMVLIGLGLNLALARQMTTPLRTLTTVSREMANGNTKIRVDVESTDEIGQLGEAFNYMSTAIAAREAELHKLTESLEKTVQIRTKELQKRNQELVQMAISDRLTKINNRRNFFALAEKEYQRAQRYKHPLSLVLIDIDHFKKVNDTYGHQVGDDVLAKTAFFLERNIRSVDIVARYGGEEFIILMPEISCQHANLIAERLRQCIAETPMAEEHHKVMITISSGISCLDNKDELSFDTLLYRADQALYRSKDEGRNRTTIW